MMFSSLTVGTERFSFPSVSWTDPPLLCSSLSWSSRKSSVQLEYFIIFVYQIFYFTWILLMEAKASPMAPIAVGK